MRPRPAAGRGRLILVSPPCPAPGNEGPDPLYELETEALIIAAWLRGPLLHGATYFVLVSGGKEEHTIALLGVN